MRNKKRFWLSALSFHFLTSCTIAPPDVPACEHLGFRVFENDAGVLVLEPSPACFEKIGENECGHCVFILSGREQYVGEKPEHHLNGKPWAQIRAESVLLPAAEAYAPLAAYAINACKKLKCNSELEQFRGKFGK